MSVEYSGTAGALTGFAMGWWVIADATQQDLYWPTIAVLSLMAASVAVIWWESRR